MYYFSGPSLSTATEFATMVEYEKSLLLVGGKDGQYHDHGLHLWQLTSPMDEKWIKLDQHLDEPRFFNVAFIVPDKILDCELIQ
jgi:hypothetical protein